MGFAYARTKINKIRYDTELKSCRKLKKLISFLKKPEQVCQKELNEWKELIDIYEGRDQKYLRRN